MAQDYRYFAANERTFLAWMRTAITVMALGFALDKFEILASLAAGDVTLKKDPAGLWLIGLGLAIIAGGWLRYVRVRRDLRDDSDRAYRSGLLSTALAALLLAVGSGLLFTLLY